ncbi:hypothetical protein F5X68DRAFT_268366 [Plectosphaerella plurivora]|uniref:Zn(2)-C6 fungal-type domain-containing protein n=1 Tax=Plectosphaerella plurivora TaxID=936078 RepID=A0A9P8VCQ2_9PEZI|nr:hypothetical protein F5X68DRAFT_268366 [Plectosphaerella plurivora]
MRPLSACIACRDRRKKCERSRPGISCNFCIKRGIECIGVVESPPAASCSSRKQYERLDGRLEDGSSRRQVSSLVVPDAALCEELVELYFRYAHVAFHNIFHRTTFIASVRDSSIPKILFFGVASLSARYSEHPVFAAIAPWDRGRDPNTEAVYHAIASRMATLLDLPTMTTESVLEQEINRRVWWSLITTETWTSASQSLPRLIRPRDTVPLPMDERMFIALDYETPLAPVEFDQQAVSPSGDPSQSLVAQMIRLNILLYEIVLYNARIVAERVHLCEPGSPAMPSLDRGNTLMHALDDWANNLSPLLQYSDDNVAYWVEEGLGPIFITLHINYNHAGQLLFYQHLHSAQSLDPDSPVADMVRVFAQRCNHHATNLCDLIHHAKQRPETIVLYPLAGHILCLASSVQIHTLLFEIDDDDIAAAKTRLERNFEMISSMNNYWPMNHMSISRLQHFHNACLRSKDDSFRLDAWMLRFLLGFTHDIEDREIESPQTFDHLRNLLDI